MFLDKNQKTHVNYWDFKSKGQYEFSNKMQLFFNAKTNQTITKHCSLIIILGDLEFQAYLMVKQHYK